MSRQTLLGLLAILLWSVTVGLARSLSEKVGPLTGGAGVYLVAGTICLLRQGGFRPRRASFPPHYLFGCGALFVFYLLSFYLAIGMARDRVEVLSVGLANYLWPTLTILFSLPLLRKRANLLLVPGTLAALAGIFLAVTEGGRMFSKAIPAPFADRFAIVALAAAGAVMWALYSNLTSRWMGDRSESGVGLFMLATGFVLLLLQLSGIGPGPWTPVEWTARSIGELLCLGVATGAGYECWEAAMRRGDVTLVAAASYATPLLSTLFTCLYLGVRPGAELWAGCGLVVAGSLLSWKAVSSLPV